MMMNLLKYTLLTFLLSFAACSGVDDGAPNVHNGQPQPGDALELTVSAADFVTDGAPDTRATDNDKTTTFEEGDRVGIIILDTDNNPIYDNIPYKYDSNEQKWVFDDGDGKGGCYYDPKAKTYIVYYPYSRAADGVKSKEALKTKFAPKFDQSDIKDYRSSDLMVWDSKEHLASSVTTLNVELEHAFASVYLTPKVTGKYKLEDNKPYNGFYVPDISDISDVSLTIDNVVYVPYQATDGSLRCIIPINITSRDIRCFYTIGGKTYGNTINISGTGEVAANTRYACEPKIGDVTYSLGNARVGDFYCKNNDKGYLIPGDATLSDAQKAVCIGIVYCTDIDRIGDEAKKVLKDKGVATPHGLVMALTNASAACQWGNNGTDENSGGDVGTPFQDNTNTLQKHYNNIDGYGETHWILNTYDGDALLNTYTAFYHASRYGTAEAQAQYAAPNTTTGWFIPSMGQWWDILSNLGGINLTTYHESDKFHASISGVAETAVDNMNKYLGKIKGATTFRTETYFWSSSEFSSDYACYVGFRSDGYLDLGSRSHKGNSRDNVRCVFAF